jgi:translation initiation factor IF-2
VVGSEREARSIMEERKEAERVSRLATGPGGSPGGVTLENLFASIAEGQKKCLKIILKGDVQGSVEAITESLRKIQSQKIDLDIVLSAIGPISESDILLAKASGAVVIGFNTKTDNSAANAAKREGIQIKLFSIIYELVDQVKEAMTGMLEPELRETPLGNALVKKVFELSKFMVAGCQVQSGRVTKSGRARVLRKKQPIYDGGVVTLKRFQEDVNEVRQGLECGIRLGNFDEYEEGDIIECYQLEKVPQTL